MIRFLQQKKTVYNLNSAPCIILWNMNQFCSVKALMIDCPCQFYKTFLDKNPCLIQKLRTISSHHFPISRKVIFRSEKEWVQSYRINSVDQISSCQDEYEKHLNDETHANSIQKLKFEKTHCLRKLLHMLKAICWRREYIWDLMLLAGSQ